MPSWWGKSSSKEAKKKTSKESFIGTLHRKFRSTSDEKSIGRLEGSRRHCSEVVSEIGSQSCTQSRSTLPSKHVARCQSFVERPQAQPLPLPALHPSSVGHTNSGVNVSTKAKLEKGSKSPLFLPLPRPECISNRTDPADVDGDMVTASISSECSIDSDDQTNSHQHSPFTSDCEVGTKTATNIPYSAVVNKQSFVQIDSREALKSTSPSLDDRVSLLHPSRRPLHNNIPHLQVPCHGTLSSAPDSSMSSPSRSPMRVFGGEQVNFSALWAGKPYQDLPFLGSGNCSSPGSGQNSGHNSMGGDISGQVFWQHSRGSPEYSPIPSPGTSSRVQSGAVTPLHPRAGEATHESRTSWLDDGKQKSHRLPLPPLAIPYSSPLSHTNSAATSPSLTRSPARADSTSPGPCWKKGTLLGRGSFGHVYVGFNCESGEMCAMKEVPLFSDDAKSKESAKQLGQEITLLSRLRHPNIVQYYGSEIVGDKLYIYLEYISGGSIYKLLQDYGPFGESAIRSYTQQILSGLAYLHAKNTVHRDIKGANILVDPNGRVKLADFGMAKHITGQTCPLSFKGSPYWMAPEVITNSNGCNLAVDIWSLGCTILEMATSKPPWSQYEGVAAMFKIGNSKELPAIPDHLSYDGKDFVIKCLQRNPLYRPKAAQLLEHPFVKTAAPLEKPIICCEPGDPSAGATNGVKSLGTRNFGNNSMLGSERFAVHLSGISKSSFSSRHVSCPVSPIGSPLLHQRSPENLSVRMSTSPISSPLTTSGSSTPLSGGSGGIPVRHLSQSAYLHGLFGSMPKPQYSPCVNGPFIHEAKPDKFQGLQSRHHAFHEFASSEGDTLGRQMGRPADRVLYDGQLVLADHISQKFLEDNVKLNPSLDLNALASLPGHTT